MGDNLRSKVHHPVNNVLHSHPVKTTVYKTVMQPGALIYAEVSLFMRRMQFTLSLKTFYEEIDM